MFTLLSCRLAVPEMEKLSAQLQMFTEENGVSICTFSITLLAGSVLKLVAKLIGFAAHHYKHWGICLALAATAFHNISTILETVTVISSSKCKVENSLSRERDSLSVEIIVVSMKGLPCLLFLK